MESTIIVLWVLVIVFLVKGLRRVMMSHKISRCELTNNNLLVVLGVLRVGQVLFQLVWFNLHVRELL